MSLQKYREFSVGDRVTAKHEKEAYFSEGAKGFTADGSSAPLVVFKPGMEAVIVHIPPKVRIIKNPPIQDAGEYFLCCDFIDNSGFKNRVSLNICNATKLK